jgi:hypothetical protein
MHHLAIHAWLAHADPSRSLRSLHLAPASKDVAGGDGIQASCVYSVYLGSLVARAVSLSVYGSCTPGVPRLRLSCMRTSRRPSPIPRRAALAEVVYPPALIVPSKAAIYGSATLADMSYSLLVSCARRRWGPCPRRILRAVWLPSHARVNFYWARISLHAANALPRMHTMARTA